MKATSKAGSQLLPGVDLGSITPPEITGVTLVRPRLLEFITQSAPRALIVMAPGGFGKTLLGAQFAAMNPTRTVWFRGNEKDTPEITLSRMVCAIRRVIPHLYESFEVGKLNDEIAQKHVDVIAQEMADFGEVINFVYENMEKRPTGLVKNDEYWANSLPLNIRTLSLRRNPPMANYSKAIKLDVLRYMTANELAFTSDEITQYAQALRIDISDQETRDYLTQLNGWPAGISLLFDALLHQNPNNSKHLEVCSARDYLPINYSNLFKNYANARDFNLTNFVGTLSKNVYTVVNNKQVGTDFLTAREQEILRYLDSEVTIAALAANLHLSMNTIKSHLKNIYRKLGVKSRTQAVDRGRELYLL